MSDKNNTTAHEAVRDAIRKAYDDGYNDAKMAPDNCSTYCGQRAEREGTAALLSKLRAEGVQAGDETQALIEHDRWFSEYGQRLGSFYNSLTIHTRAAWVAASNRYAALANTPVTDERTIHPEIQAVLAMLDVPVLGYLGSHSGKLLKSADMADSFESAIPLVSESAHRAACEKIIGSWASAPVAGEAVNLKAAREYLGQWGCLADSNVRALLENAERAAPQAREAVRYVAEPNRCHCHPETCGCKDYQVRDTHGKEPKITVFDLDEAEQLAKSLNRAALSAQPGAQKDEK